MEKKGKEKKKVIKNEKLFELWNSVHVNHTVCALVRIIFFCKLMSG